MNEDTLRMLIADGAGLADGMVQPYHTEGKRPGNLASKSETYATLRLMEDDAVGLPGQIELSDARLQHFALLSRAHYDLQFFGKHAVLAARRFRLWTHSEAAIRAEETHGIRFPDRLRIVRMLAPIAPGWEPRVVIDLAVEYIFRRADAFLPIERVTIDISEEAPASGSLLHQINIPDGT